MADVSEFIGVPFKYGGRGPHEYDCYGLVMELSRRDGIVLPDYRSPTDGARIAALMSAELRLWEPTEQRPGAVALFRLMGNTHVGYMLEGGRFIHTWEKSGGVVIERIDLWRYRLIGFYRYVGE